MATDEDIGLEERLKSALWLSIGKIVDEETMKLGVNATPQFIGALTELVWVQIAAGGEAAKKRRGFASRKPGIPNAVNASSYRHTEYDHDATHAPSIKTCEQ
ncbi:uncharacterized protein BDV14DRAFT_201783 [Aspergillus stella-maris]|uniref:uncharacterized protein n=1 Tax=Aspergillus stella-maris TaxID=1810926 RepID=UPI003CCDC2F9